MQAEREEEVQLHPFLTSTLEGVGGQRHAAAQSPLHIVMCPKNSVNGYEGEHFLAPTVFRTPDPPSGDHYLYCISYAIHVVSKRKTQNQ
jgi:hypothetical protein